MDEDLSDEEDNCRYGTPLDPYEDDELPRKKSNYQDVSEQYALDAHGKRRFHGAFTGGFTAGHGNTVSAPEGWTPSTFKSSRADRVQKKQFQKPEDFMDEEDRSEFGIAPREVQPTKEFGGSKRKRQMQFHEGPIPGEPVLQVLLQPAHETVAMKILRSMGWKPGKGIGERQTRAERAQARKVYTCHIPEEFRKNFPSSEENPEVSGEESDEDEYSDVMFEPDDFEPYLAKPKTDTFGLGYSGLSRHSVLGTLRTSDTKEGEWKGSHLVTSDKGRKVSIRGQAFGVGALEEDDEDIYAREDMSSYDFSLEASGKSKDKQPGGSKGKQGITSHRSVLEGFVPASKPAHYIKVYPPPSLPHGYTPTPPRASRFSVQSTSSPAVEIRDRGLGRHDLTAEQRGVILGESQSTVLPKENVPSTSNTSKDSNSNLSFEERIAAITGKNVHFVSDSTSASGDEQSSNAESKGISETSSKFKPFASNPEKQKRYEEFVKSKDGGGDFADDQIKLAPKDRLKEWERVREASEFEQAFKLYKPLTGLMNDRFVSATKADDVITVSDKSNLRNFTKYASDEKLEAARLGMFGKLTREVSNWMPEPLLCRRFNVPEPNNGGYASNIREKKKLTYSIFEYLETPVHNKNSFLKEQSGIKDSATATPKTSEKIVTSTTEVVEKISTIPEKVEPVKSKRLTVAELFLQEKEKERERSLKKPQLDFQKQLSGQKSEDSDVVKETIDNFNKIDLYKAVFLSDSESDSETAPESNNNKEKDVISGSNNNDIVRKVLDSPPRNIERNKSPPRGIFANVDFDKLNAWQNSATRSDDLTAIPETHKTTDEHRAKESDKGDKKKPVDDSKRREMDDISADLYGPKLPEKHIFIPKTVRLTEDEAVAIEVDSSSSSSDSWVEADKAKSKKVKKSRKHKKSGKRRSHEHRHKSKKKHKKKKD